MATFPRPGYEHLAGLLFVTTAAAETKLGAANVNHVRDQVGPDRVFTIPAPIIDVHDAAKKVGAELRRLAPNTGVVILGDYETVPSRVIEIVSHDFLEAHPESNLGVDNDKWLVWNDDLYGDSDARGFARLPVSRIPVVPQVGGILGDPRREPRDNPAAYCLGSTDFDFVEGISNTFFPAPSFHQSPPMVAAHNAPAGTAEANKLKEGSLAADSLYLGLHGTAGQKAKFIGRSTGNRDRVAVDFQVAGGSYTSRGTVFAGVCWGALSATAAITVFERKVTPTTRDRTKSLAVSFFDRGANAFVGFTAAHYVPKGVVPHLILGAPLHSYFWHYAARLGWPPAKALYQAKVQFLRNSAQFSSDRLAQATDMKTFWSATCLGLGW